MGGLSDRIGRRKVLIPAIIGFSLLSGFSGLATGFLSLILIRAVMGLTEGSFCPTSVGAAAARCASIAGQSRAASIQRGSPGPER